MTALRKHLLRAEPVIALHACEGGIGNPEVLAWKLHSGLAFTKTPPEVASQPPAAAQSIGIDMTAINQVLGAQGKVNGGVLQYSIPRREQITEDGMTVSPPLGSAIGINFQPTGTGKTAITGDFVLTARR